MNAQTAIEHDRRTSPLLAALTLVSTSPQRSELLRQAGYRFDIVRPRLEEPEDRHPRMSAARYAQAQAYFKARSVAEQLPDRLLLGADTVVAAEGHVLSKPTDRDDARRMLRLITRTPHEVITGVALLAPALERRVIAHEATRVVMRPIPDEQIERYLETGGWRDKAGAYGLQAGADAFVDRIDGSRSNVIGLPLELLARLLRRIV